MDKEFFVCQVEACSGMLYRIAYTILRSDDACQDAMQDTALRAWKRRGLLREEQYFRSWIVRILINVCYDMKRRRKRFVSLEDIPEPAVGAPDVSLAMALQSLPEGLRLPLVMHCSEEMSYEEIARVLKIPAATVRGRIYRARKELRKELDEHDA